MTECNVTSLPFRPQGRREIVADFNGEMINSDARVFGRSLGAATSGCQLSFAGGTE